MSSSEAPTPSDCIELLKAAGEFVQLDVARKQRRDLVVRLARRITADWRLSDEEALRAASDAAIAALALAQKE